MTRVPPMWPGFDSILETIRALSLLVLYAALSGFSPGASFFQLLKIRKFTAMITLLFQLQPQYNMNFIYISHHFTAREDMNSTNQPRFQCVASQRTWSRIAPVSWRSRVRIPLKP